MWVYLNTHLFNLVLKHMSLLSNFRHILLPVLRNFVYIVFDMCWNLLNVVNHCRCFGCFNYFTYRQKSSTIFVVCRNTIWTTGVVMVLTEMGVFHIVILTVIPDFWNRWRQLMIIFYRNNTMISRRLRNLVMVLTVVA